MQFQAFVLAVRDIAKTKLHLDRHGADYSLKGERLIVFPTAGQGTTIMFEEVA